MIQPLRNAHRRTFAALAMVLPAIIWAGLGARHLRQRMVRPTPQLTSSTQLLRKSDSLWQKHAMQSEFYGSSENPDDIFVVLSPITPHSPQELIEPDLLLYWSADRPQGDSVPPEARVLGGFIEGQAFPLPKGGGRTGYLVLYSLPHHTVFDSANVEPPR